MQRKIMHTLTALSLSALSFSLGSVAVADGASYSDGPVTNVSYIRTLDGHFDEYMKWLQTSWKKQEEAAKKAGLITGYRIYLAQPQTPNDPDIYLIVEFKNWAALDGLGGKFDKLSVEMEGSLDKADQAQAERGKIRTIIGSQTLQEAVLK